MPPLYPNLVTLTRDVDVLERVAELDSGLPPGWGVKDSFKDLELGDQGFSVAFEALWYCRAPGENPTNGTATRISVENVTTQSELNRWEAAWGEQTEVFKPSLLSNDDVELVYVEQDGNLIGGLAANRSGRALGISNAFGQPDGILACIESVGAKHPDKALVGYGSEAELAALSMIGFRGIGELQIWLRNQSSRGR